MNESNIHNNPNFQVDGISYDRQIYFTSILFSNLQKDEHYLNWTDPTNITQKIKLPLWSWYATGPGNGIQLSDEKLVIPCNHAIYMKDKIHPYSYPLPKKGPSLLRSHLIYCDRHDDDSDIYNDWKIRNIGPIHTSESCVSKLITKTNNLIIHNSRHWNTDIDYRTITYYDGITEKKETERIKI